MKFRLRLFPRFLALLMALAVVPVALVGRLVNSINTESLQFEVQRYHLKLAQSLAEKFDERLSSTIRQLGLALDSLKNPSASWEDRQKILSALIDASPDFAIISAVARNGQEVIKAYSPTLAPEVDENPSLISHTASPLFQAFQKSGRQEILVARVNNRTMAEIYLPFDKNALYVKISINDLCEMIVQESIGQTGFATYVGKNGEELSAPHKFSSGHERSLDQSMIKTALTGSLGAREFLDDSGNAWIGASAPVSRLGGAIFTQQKREEAFRKSIEGERKALLVTFLTIVVAIFVAAVFARSLIRPLLTITKVARTVDLANGQFPDAVQVNTKDEIEELAQTFNDMLQKLRGYADLQVEKLLIEQKKTEAIIFSIKDGILMTDYQGKIQLANRMARSILGLPEDSQLLGEPLWKFLPSAELKTACMELLTNPQNGKALEVKLQHNEKDAYFTLSAEQVRSPAKQEVQGMVTVLHDITLEKELDSMKEEFLHSITHDLRNPLTAIRGFIRLFQSGQTGQLTPMQTKMFETMDKASLRLTNMVNDILDLARLEANRLTLHIEPSKLTDVANRVAELFLPQTNTSSIALKTVVVNEPPPIQIDPNLIERVFINLVGNATKFTPDNGAITIRIEDQGAMVRCSVEDTGEGIPKDYLDKVFDKFKQVEGHFKGGAGLGLTICKRIVEGHMGRIWVESEVGKGANFIFVLPKNLNKLLEAKAA